MGKSSKWVPRKKTCRACSEPNLVSYLQPQNLLKFTTAQAKMYGRRRSDLCAKCQRQFARNIKWARFLALVPYVAD